jgi:UDP-N-acetylmuramoyl-tripeptide--D-alanyl-D-alanine ligase
MLQQVDYETSDFISWLMRWPDYSRIIKRKRLILTAKIKLLLVILYSSALLMVLAAIYLLPGENYFISLLIIVSTPLVLLVALLIINSLGNLLLIARRTTAIKRASQKMNKHPGVKVAILGSYGKTTAKELLAAVLSSEKRVAYSLGNRNILSSHASWINSSINGDEDFVIFEFGEYRQGDIAKLAELTHPNYAIITGYAPNHLDSYKTEQALKDDLKSIQKYVKRSNLFVSNQAAHELGFKADFSRDEFRGWKIRHHEVSLDGLRFDLEKGSQKVAIQTKLIGGHLTGLVAAIYFVAREMGISKDAAVAALAKIEPYDHRMNPRNLHGAWIIDDTYNGNLEGIKAGIELLKEVKAKRKIYVTPGLVEQGDKKDAVHRNIAQHLARAHFQEVVLIKNSATSIIADELKALNYDGKVTFVDEPLEYYTNLEYNVAAGDVVLLQNDWTDNYH